LGQQADCLHCTSSYDDLLWVKGKRSSGSEMGCYRFAQPRLAGRVAILAARRSTGSLRKRSPPFAKWKGGGRRPASAERHKSGPRRYYDVRLRSRRGLERFGGPRSVSLHSIVHRKMVGHVGARTSTTLQVTVSHELIVSGGDSVAGDA
jgi:hypothetical protein